MAHLEWPQPVTTMGWRCPACQAVWSPTITGCLNCAGTRQASQGCTCASGWPLMCPTHNGDNSWFPAHAGTVDFIAKGHLGTPCPKPRDGGMCGCDEDGDTPPKVCLSSECDCV